MNMKGALVHCKQCVREPFRRSIPTTSRGGVALASFHFHKNLIARGAKATGSRNTVAASAYISAEPMRDEKQARTWDYSKTSDRVVHDEIMLPDDAPEQFADRSFLWNSAEAAARRKDAQLAMMYEVALPHELTDAQRLQLVRDYVRDTFTAEGRPAEFSIHRPTKDQDARQFHAHIMVSMRTMDAGGWGKQWRMSKEDFANKADLAKRERETWARYENHALQAAGLDVRVDPRSLAAQGVDREPEQHEGHKVTAKKRRHEQTNIGDENTARQERNSDRAKRHMKALHEMVRIEEERASFETWQAETRAKLESAQGLSMLDLEMKLEAEAIQHEEQIQAFYAPSLKTVHAEAERLEKIVSGSGILLSARRLFRGAKDRDELGALRHTIEDTQKRMQEARQKVDAAHAVQKARLAALQEQKRQEQHEGFERAREKKEAAFADRMATARKEAQETAREGFDMAADVERVKSSKDQWREERRAMLKEKAAEIGEGKSKAADRGYEP